MRTRSVWPALAFALAACAHRPPPERTPVAPAHSPPAQQAPTPPAPPPPSPAEDDGPLEDDLPASEAATRVAVLSLEEKLGQLMMVGFAGRTVDDEGRRVLQGLKVGGVCLFKRNVHSAEQVARLNDQVRALLPGLPPFLAVDQEGGNVVRLSLGNVVLPGNMALGATRQPGLAYQAARAQAEDLRLLGFNMNLAPVLDVNVNPKNPVIGIRSFGDRVELVTRLGLEFIRGQRDAGLITIAKHFPGHGRTALDSHRGLPVVDDTEPELLEQSAPFQAATREGLDGMMTAHVAVPRVTGDDLPATLSPKLLGGLLRERLGYRGLVITDELEMDAIDRRFGVGRAAVMAIQAGADMVLVPWRPQKQAEVYQALLDAARSGELSQARIDEAVLRIVSLKLDRGLLGPPEPLALRLRRLGARRKVASAIARASVTLLRANRRHFPLRPGQRIGVITAEPSLARAIQARSPGAEVLLVPAYPGPRRRVALREQARQLAQRSEVVVVGLLNSRHVDLVHAAAAEDRPVLAVAMGLPYLAEHLKPAQAVLTVYSYRDTATEAAAAALFGETGTPGKLPVHLPSYPFGHGLELRLPRAQPPRPDSG